jgi:predicted ester cyclase
MPATEHVRLIGRIADAFNAGTLHLIDDLVSPSLTDFTRDLAMAKAAFPDARFTVEDVVGEDDKLVDRYTISGTHQHPFLGIAATGKQVRMAGITIVRIAGGRSSNVGRSPTNSACSSNSTPFPRASRSGSGHEPPATYA